MSKRSTKAQVIWDENIRTRKLAFEEWLKTLVSEQAKPGDLVSFSLEPNSEILAGVVFEPGEGCGLFVAINGKQRELRKLFNLDFVSISDSC